MSQINELIQKRFEELLQETSRFSYRNTGSITRVIAEPQAFYSWSSSVLNLLHGVFGSQNPHYVRFDAETSGMSNHYIPDHLVNACIGIFKGAMSDFEGGYLFEVEKSFAGEIFGDLVALAKASMNEGQHTVAAVLASAALEDALKRYALANGLNVEGNTMDQVVNALKSKGLVSGPQKALLSAMPKIRNQAMHAEWDKITPQDAGSIIGYVEQFLLTNFS